MVAVAQIIEVAKVVVVVIFVFVIIAIQLLRIPRTTQNCKGSNNSPGLVPRAC